jgi:predicted O-methyltransferase YrrM
MNSFTLEDIKALIQQSLKEEPTGDFWLDARYDEQVGIIGHTNPYYRLFYLIAQTLKPNLTVELGAWRGDASSHFAVGNPAGRVVAVDIHKDDDFAGLAKLNEAVNHLPNMSFLQMWIADAAPIVAAYGPIECIFFDGWHDMEHVSDDWNRYKPLLADKALCIFDDITAAYLFEGMREFWDSLPGEKYLSTEGIHGDIPVGFLIWDSGVKTSEQPKRRGRPKATKE